MRAGPSNEEDCYWRNDKKPMRKMRRLCLHIGVLLLLLCETGIASERNDSHVQKHSAEKDTTTLLQWVDEAHAHISQGVLSMSKGIDGLFGDEHLDKDSDHSCIAILPSIEFAKNDKPDMGFPVHLKLAFPHLEDRFQLFLDAMLKEEKSSKQEELNDEKETGKEDEEEKPRLIFGFQYKILQKAREWVTLGGDINIRADKEVPWTKGWFRKRVDFDQWFVQLTQYLLWYRENSWGEKSRIDVERWLNQATIFETTSQATWSEYTEGLDFSQSFRLHHRLSPDWSIALKFSADGHTKPTVAVDKWRTALTMRHRLYKNWLFVEVEPELEFLREDHFTLNSLLTCHVEMRFGDVSW